MNKNFFHNHLRTFPEKVLNEDDSGEDKSSAILCQKFNVKKYKT